MRLKPAEIDAFISAGGRDSQIILIYGPDEGLVRERSRILANALLTDPADPFALLDLSEDEYRSDPARLHDEFGAISMFGGKRVIRIRFRSDRYGKQIKAFVESLESGQLSGDAVVILEAGDLKPSSSLRKTLEACKFGAALPCYQDDARSLKALAGKMLKDADIQYTNDIIDWLVESLGSDRAMTRREVEKLILYKQSDQNSELTAGDIAACLTAANDLGLEDVTYSALSGDIDMLAKSLDRCFLQAEQPVTIIRALSRHIERLRLARLAMEQGATDRQAVEQLRPKPHFKRKAAFERQLRSWGIPKINKAIELLYEAEKNCKTTGLPAEAICTQMSFRIARAAGGRR